MQKTEIWHAKVCVRISVSVKYIVQVANWEAAVAILQPKANRTVTSELFSQTKRYTGFDWEMTRHINILLWINLAWQAELLSCAVEVFVSDHAWDRPKFLVPPGGMKHFSTRFVHQHFSLTTTQCVYVMSEWLYLQERHHDVVVTSGRFTSTDLANCVKIKIYGRSKLVLITISCDCECWWYNLVCRCFVYTWWRLWFNCFIWAKLTQTKYR